MNMSKRVVSYQTEVACILLPINTIAYKTQRRTMSLFPTFAMP